MNRGMALVPLGFTNLSFGGDNFKKRNKSSGAAGYLA
jgi:hypothetical protein